MQKKTKPAILLNKPWSSPSLQKIPYGSGLQAGRKPTPALLEVIGIQPAGTPHHLEDALEETPNRFFPSPPRQAGRSSKMGHQKIQR
jgi:hypothetical protein